MLPDVGVLVMRVDDGDDGDDDDDENLIAFMSMVLEIIRWIDCNKVSNSDLRWWCELEEGSLLRGDDDDDDDGNNDDDEEEEEDM